MIVGVFLFNSMRLSFMLFKTLLLDTYSLLHVLHKLIYNYCKVFLFICATITCPADNYSYINKAIPDLLWLLLTWHIFNHPFSFKLSVSLYLNWISYRQQIVRPCFFIQSNEPLPLTGAWSSFTLAELLTRLDLSVSSWYFFYICPICSFFLLLFFFF